MADADQVRRQIVGAHMVTLLQSPEWAALEREIREMEGRLVESLVTQAGHIELLQGEIRGVRRVLDLPRFLISRGKGYDG